MGVFIGQKKNPIWRAMSVFIGVKIKRAAESERLTLDTGQSLFFQIFFSTADL